MNWREKIDEEEVLAVIWGLFGAYSGNLATETFSLPDAFEVYAVSMFFFASYIVADEFIKRARCHI